MKLRSTTPASISLAARVLIVIVGLLALVSVPAQLTKTVSADPYDDKIRALQQDIKRYKSETAKLSEQAANLQTALAQITRQKAAIQAQIDINQLKHDKLVAEIKKNEQKIKDNQSALGDIIASIYVDDKITPLEMLASSNNISDYLDKQEFRDSVRDELTDTIDEIKALKRKLDKQRSEIAEILSDQKGQRNALAGKQYEQQAILNKTRGSEANYQRLIKNSQAQIAEARATQALLNARYSGGGVTMVAGGVAPDYPWNASNCPMVMGFYSSGGADGSGGDGYGYGCRQCVSYVAWRMAKETGVYPRWGNAVDFPANARAAGYRTGGPKAGSIGVIDPYNAGQSYGHVVWVEAVSGGSVLVSQYNYDYGAGYGMYSKMWLSAGSYDHYIHIL